MHRGQRSLPAGRSRMKISIDGDDYVLVLPDDTNHRVLLELTRQVPILFFLRRKISNKLFNRISEVLEEGVYTPRDRE